jgi:fluoride exporter
MISWLMVGAGGALGSLLRHGVNGLVLQSWPALRFPVATLIVNVAGSAAFGYVAGLLASNRVSMQPHWREFLFVGILGGFTTFSTFAGEVVMLAKSGLHVQAIATLLAQVSLAIIALYVGMQIGLRSS